MHLELLTNMWLRGYSKDLVFLTIVNVNILLYQHVLQ